MRTGDKIVFLHCISHILYIIIIIIDFLTYLLTYFLFTHICLQNFSNFSKVKVALLGLGTSLQLRRISCTKRNRRIRGTESPSFCKFGNQNVPRCKACDKMYRMTWEACHKSMSLKYKIYIFPFRKDNISQIYSSHKFLE